MWCGGDGGVGVVGVGVWYGGGFLCWWCVDVEIMS